MTDSQFVNQFRREEEDKALAADRYRRLLETERAAHARPRPRPGLMCSNSWKNSG
jgi:hypothetical protein